MSETHPPSIRGSAIGLAQTGFALGILLGPLIGGLLFEKVGRAKTFRFAAAVVLANALGQLLWMMIAPPEVHKASEVTTVSKQADRNIKDKQQYSIKNSKGI